MKKILNIMVVMLLIPLLNVNALSCGADNEKTAIKPEDNNFSCSDINGESLKFLYGTDDISSHFQTREIVDKKTTIDIINKEFNLSNEHEYWLVSVSDGTNSTYIYILNKNYVEPTTTTTTKDPNIKTLTVTLDPNNGSEIEEKTCDVKNNNTTCSITLPKIDKETFNGWGTAKTCKEGNIGTIKVEKDITYYACYKDNEESINTPITEEETKLLLKTLSLINKTNNESIDFGTFSIKKQEYSFKVLNDVENIEVNATAEENIKIEITGNENLVVGENKIIILLTDEDNNTNEYILNVTRLNEGETIDNIHYLKSLIVGGYEINFNKEKLVYSLTIPSNIDKLEMTAISENENDIVEIKNNENLTDGSQILINITGEDELTTSYMINITKEASTNYLLIGAIAFILLLIILLIILIIIKSNKKKKNSPKNNGNNNQIEVLNI